MEQLMILKFCRLCGTPMYREMEISCMYKTLYGIAHNWERHESIRSIIEFCDGRPYCEECNDQFLALPTFSKIKKMRPSLEKESLLFIYKIKNYGKD